MILVALSALAAAACVPAAPDASDAAGAEPVASPTVNVTEAVTATVIASAPESETETPVSPGRLFIFSNSSPHISIIDTETNTVVGSADLPNFTAWGWNDDNNYFDGENLWLSLRDPATDDAEVIALDLETLEIDARLPIGKENLTVYIGKATNDGRLLVSKMGAGEVVVIDTLDPTVLETWEVPVNGDVACDADIAVGPDGVERFYYPTRNGDTVVSLDPQSGEPLVIVDTPDGSTPLMMTVAPDNTVWVQETDSNTNTVFDPVTLDVIGRFPTGDGPIIASFDRAGRYGFIGHGRDTVVTVVDAATLEEVATVEVGTNPQKLAVHPSGDTFYAILTREAAVAVIDTATWKVVERIPLGTNPTGIYIEQGS